MPPTDKPMNILTKAEVAELKDNVDDDGCFVDVDLQRITATIELFAELLESCLYAHNAELKKQANIRVAKAVASYHGTATETKEGGGGDSAIRV